MSDEYLFSGVKVLDVGSWILPADPQVIANNLTLDGGDTGLHTLLKHPLNIDGLPVVPARRAPEVGGHTRQVLMELGYSEAQIDAMQTAGAF